MNSIEQLLAQLEDGKRRILFDPWGKNKGESWNFGDGIFCTINVQRNEGEFDEVMTLLHELLHDHESFVDRHLSREDPDIERDIDKESLRILAEEPEVFEYLLTKLREAKAFQIREICKDIWVNLKKETDRKYDSFIIKNFMKRLTESDKKLIIKGGYHG